MAQVVIGTAGHIDHGKTALVKALTGTDTDRLPEEKKRGMTIDLGFAFLSDNITIIDVPGHEKFIRNMVAGVTSVDIALITVAADDGIMPQTREHIDILRLLGIHQGCIAITKVDLIEDTEWIDLLEEDIRGYMNGSFLENFPILRVSSETGEGVEQVKGTLLHLARQVVKKEGRGFFRLFVDRAFSMKGFGTVVTGTVVSGSVSVGDEVELLPNQVVAKIRGLQSHGLTVQSVGLGDRAALNLTGVEKTELWRGSQVVTRGSIDPTDAVGAEIFMLSTTDREIEHEQRVRVHLGTDEIMGKVLLAASGREKSISPGQTATVLIKLERIAAVALDDPVIVRFYSPPETIGGGVVVDTSPPSRWKQARLWLKSLGGLRQTERLERFLASTVNEPLTLSGWSQRWQVSEQVFRQSLADLEITEFGSKGSPFITLSSAVDSQKQACIEALSDFHRRYPYRGGITRDRLRKDLGFSAGLFEFLIEELETGGEIETAEGLIRISGFRIELSDEDEKIIIRLEKILKGERFTPPSLSDLAGMVELTVEKTLQFMHILKGKGKAVEVGRELWFHTEHLNWADAEIRAFLEAHTSMAVNDFKSLTNTTRKHAIPLLEYFDRCRVTQRQGDRRVLFS